MQRVLMPGRFHYNAFALKNQVKLQETNLAGNICCSGRSAAAVLKSDAAPRQLGVIFKEKYSFVMLAE